ncbi:MAG TPA: dihydroorotase, partial [Cytophagaceae bacterium]
PNTKPVIQSKDVVSYIRSKSQPNLVEVHPIGAVTLDNKGQELTEMIDLHHSGAIAFSDGNKPIWHSDVFLKSLQYLQLFDGLLIDHPEDLHLTHSGQMNEGVVSTTLGLKGIPKLAEEVNVERDLKILEYTGGKLHLAHITSPASVDLIRQAKAKGLHVTCDVAFYHLILDDSLLTSFDTNLKVNPPLRTSSDIDALWAGLADGTIDVIVSEHTPQDIESKNLEFDLAEFGMIGLETFFGALNNANRLSMEELVYKFTQRPREVLGMKVPVIEKGATANLTVFDPGIEWEFKEKDIRSKSKNSPFINQRLKGKAVAVFNKNQFILNQ